MHIILTGASGNVGFPILRRCLVTPSITRVSILSRRPFPLPTGPGVDATKANLILHDDFDRYTPECIATLAGARACIFALGVSQNDVGKEEYVRITHDYPLAAAKAFAKLNGEKPFIFTYISGEGADMDERAWTLFGNVKGRAEKALLALPASAPDLAALRVYNVRPGMVVGTHRPISFGKRVAFNALAPILNLALPSMVSPAEQLAKSVVDVALGDGEPLPAGVGIEAGGRLVRSSAIRYLGLEDSK
ncbi:uncharacterized protein EV422DRAFT_49467 [Fimicolochytrium jonesii]|uniref:uncharacterized protein n=1 Tax=Fimicolochytrium jonesii TaxID=1396493 RepID=UPI0022FE8EFB|nr:uncharacterized protein EV422DRAFT_49467 [Fimicolochytrium jonesii]KAI8821014.1 hypothetical protein EV422DRAFT_49467 [Fimicolochytrium jonesii]